MSNTINPRPLEPLLQELQGLGLSQAAIIAFRDMFTRMDKVLTNLGEVQAVAPVKGRTEGIGTTVTGLSNTGDIKATTKVVGRTEGLGTTTANLDATGKLLSTDAIAADGTGSPLTGGKRGFVALDSNNRLANSFRNTPINTTCANTSSTAISNDGSSTSNTIAASTFQFAPGTVAYNSGSYDPGSFGTTYAVTSDPTFSGGALAVSFSSTPPNQASAESNVLIGKMISSNGTPATGGGYSKGGARGLNV